MTEIQTIDETLRAKLKQLLTDKDLLVLAEKTSFSLDFVQMVLGGLCRITPENSVIVKEAKALARDYVLRG